MPRVNHKKYKFKDPMKTYSKPNRIEIKLDGGREFETLEPVLHALMDTLGFKQDGGEDDLDSVTFFYKQKRS